MVLVDGQGIPLGVHLSPAHLAESHLAEATLAHVAVPRVGRGRPKQKPRRIIADKGYDSRPLWTRLKRRGIQLIAPHRSTRVYRYQDGRCLKRYRRRWIVERTNAWLNTNCRRLTTRLERSLAVFSGFILVAVIMICLRRL